ncbi:MAG: hypothetical protein KDE15_11960, partial [Erythrobacter sp.]|nr:hypothetical protein [Erythrobacter sp.]
MTRKDAPPMLQPELPTLIDRRTLMHRSALLGAGAMLAGLPLGDAAFAQSARSGAAGRWPQVSRFIQGYVTERKVAGMVATMGYGAAEPDTLAAGERMFGGSGGVGPDTLYRIYSMT